MGFVERSGLLPAGLVGSYEPLSGGVSSDIWIVRAGQRSFCLKRALPKLRVEAEWRAPLHRSGAEVAWLRAVAGFKPEAVPAVLASDEQLGVFAMEYLPPESHEQWKQQLRRGFVSAETAAGVGRLLASLHGAFAHSHAASREFDTPERAESFFALRLEPYLLATARVHPEVAHILEDLADRTARTKISAVHGDVSPKNILIGPAGPVLIDAECACWGDPAFDLAFCLNHLLLKSLWVPSAALEFAEAFRALARGYLERVDWEPPQSLERRASHLLPALLLARVDGKSPVEYLHDEASKDTVRRVSGRLLSDLPERLADVQNAWHEK